VPLNAWWTGGELEYGLRDSGAKVLFVDAERHARLKDCYAQLPALERVVVSRCDEELGGDASRLEVLIGTRHDWAGLPDIPFPQVAVSPED
ncbi:hypothetical protein, partial [Providencia stuartii]